MSAAGVELREDAVQADHLQHFALRSEGNAGVADAAAEDVSAAGVELREDALGITTSRTSPVGPNATLTEGGGGNWIGGGGGGGVPTVQ